MPAVMQLACRRCDFAREGIQAVTIFIKADGSEVICPHPLETRYAEEATGLSWKELKRASRIRYRCGMVCLGCGDLGYYGPVSLEQAQVARHTSAIPFGASAGGGADASMPSLRTT